MGQGVIGVNKHAGHMMGMMGLMDDDAKMLCKVLEISAAQALALKKKIAMGHKLPSWAEYKIYKAGDALKSAMASTHSMRDHMPKIRISIKSGPSMGSALSSGMSPLKKLASYPPSVREGASEVPTGIPKHLRAPRKSRHGLPKQPPKHMPGAPIKGTTPPIIQKQKTAWAKVAEQRGGQVETRRVREHTAGGGRGFLSHIDRRFPDRKVVAPKTESVVKKPARKTHRWNLKGYQAPATLKGASFADRAKYIQSQGGKYNDRSTWSPTVRRQMNAWAKDLRAQRAIAKKRGVKPQKGGVRGMPAPAPPKAVSNKAPTYDMKQQMTIPPQAQGGVKGKSYIAPTGVPKDGTNTRSSASTPRSQSRAYSNPEGGINYMPAGKAPSAPKKLSAPGRIRSAGEAPRGRAFKAQDGSVNYIPSGA